MNIKKTSLILAITMIISVVFGSAITINDINKIEKDYTIINETLVSDIENVEKIVINTKNSNINVFEDDIDEIQIIHRGVYLTNQIKNISVINKDGVLKIIENNPEELFIFGVVVKESTLEIYTPLNFDKNIEIESASGDIDIKNKNMEKLQITSISGDLSLENINAQNANIDSVSGDIIANELTFDSLNTVLISGDINIKDISTNNLIIETVSGDVNIDLTKKFSDVSIEVISGDVDLKVLENENVSITFDSVSGDFESKYPMFMKDGKYISGTGENSIFVSTTSGDLSVFT